MSVTKRAVCLFGMTLFAAQLSHAQPASEKKVCADAYIAGQIARRDGHLLDARDKLTRCSEESCPVATTRDCRKWREEVEAQIPSIVIEVRDRDGRQTTNVRVKMDSELLVERIEGRAIPVDPGKHKFEFELDGATKSFDLTVLEGIKSQKVEISFEVERPRRAARPELPEMDRPVPISVYVLGGVGVVGLAGFAYFGIKSQQEAAGYRSDCGPYCGEEDTDSVRKKQVYADIFLGVGVVAIGAGTFFYLTRPSVPKRGREIGIGPLPGAYGAQLKGAF